MIKQIRKPYYMKTFLGLMAIAAICSSCYTHRDVQVDLVSAELIRIDTIVRHTQQEQQLTWRDDSKMEYISYADLNRIFRIGTRITVFRTR